MVDKNMIKLSVLGITFESKTHIFREDGFVKDVHAHARKVNQEFGDDPALYGSEILALEGKLPLVGGITRVRNNVFPILVITFYHHYDSPLKEIFIRGHEEAHVLQHTGRIDLLQKKLVVCGLNIKLEFCLNEELIADIGGLYAVIKNGFDSVSIETFLAHLEGYGKILSEIYLKFLKSKSAQSEEE